MFSKSILTILLICYIGQNLSYSQDYIPLVKENATWILNYLPDDDSIIFYFAYSISGDTIINNTEFKKVYYYNLGSSKDAPLVVVEKYLAGVLREDVQNKKIYGKLYRSYFNIIYDHPCEDLYILLPEEEILLIDFDKTQGDSIFDCQLGELDYATVIEEETIEFRYGKNRRVLKNENGLELIEGIGYEDGLFLLATSLTHAGWSHFILEYCENINLECGFLPTSIHPIEPSKLNVYPNPASDYIMVQTTEEIKNIDIFSLNGVKLISSTSNLIDISKIFYTGLCIMQIDYKNGKRETNKVIIKIL